LTISLRRGSGEKRNALPVVANRVLIERNTRGYQSNSEAEFAAVLSMIG
jgi:hypothetical protein